VPAIRPDGGTPLPAPVQQRLERAFEHPFDHVRVHDDPPAHRAAEALDAHLGLRPGATDRGLPPMRSFGMFEVGEELGRQVAAEVETWTRQALPELLASTAFELPER